MAYIPKLLSNRCGGMSFVHKGKACKLKYDGKRVKYWRCSKDKQGCNIYQFGRDKCTKAKTSHGNLPSGSTLGIQNGKKALLKSDVRKKRNPSPPYMIRSYCRIH
ncbi:hypothetical protein T01_15823 [Trichinella spiralis]|uniref:FLYWCH-type domain-containing protein n=1 Tax=Trichinella spiralis TaxID=6334 RepID=A0A0V1B0Q7_TRISP|nr:hypothetical protein T01_15823 [Trichinella spiralis]